jgi:hypothetical protein
MVIEITLPKGRSRKVVCRCGRMVQHNSMPTHVRSKKHLAWVKAACGGDVCTVESGTFLVEEEQRG